MQPKYPLFFIVDYSVSSSKSEEFYSELCEQLDEYFYSHEDKRPFVFLKNNNPVDFDFVKNCLIIASPFLALILIKLAISIFD